MVLWYLSDRNSGSSPSFPAVVRIVRGAVAVDFSPKYVGSGWEALVASTVVKTVSYGRSGTWMVNDSGRKICEVWIGAAKTTFL